MRSFFKAAAVAAVAFGVCAGAYARTSAPDHHARGALSAGRQRSSWPASWRKSLRSHWVSRSWWKTAPAAPAWSAPRTFIKSAPDGYTLFLGHTGSISMNPSLYANAGFDPRKDFTPAGLITSMPVALLAHPSFPAKTIGDVVAIAKKEGAKFNIGTSAVGTGGYL